MSALLLMRRDLTIPIADAPLPHDIVLCPFSRQLGYESRELLKRLYPEGLGDGGISFEGFWRWLTTEPGYDPKVMFVAMQGDAVVGFCHCWTGAYIKNLAVAPEVRRRGLATALVTRALQEFAQRGASAVDLETEVDNEAAQALYTKLGFTAVHHDAT